MKLLKSVGFVPVTCHIACDHVQLLFVMFVTCFPRCGVFILSVLVFCFVSGESACAEYDYREHGLSVPHAESIIITVTKTMFNNNLLVREFCMRKADKKAFHYVL